MLTLALISSIFAILFSGFFSGAEIAFFTLSHAKVRTLVKSGRKNAHLVARLLEKPDRLLTTILIGNNTVNIGSSSVVTFALSQEFGSDGVGIATGVMTFLILTFGEIVPKTVATRFAESIALRSARLLYILQYVLMPLVWFFEQFSKIPRFFLRTVAAENTITDEDVASMAAIGFDQGKLLDYERDTITNILKLNDTQIQNIMTPKSQMSMVDATATLAEVVQSMRSKHFSRLPVYDPDTDSITGFLFMKDILDYPRTKWNRITAKDIARKPLEARKNDSVHTVYRALLKKRTHLVVVYDLQNKLLGMVTLEDVIEEVLGEIYDESDVIEFAVDHSTLSQYESSSSVQLEYTKV